MRCASPSPSDCPKDSVTSSASSIPSPLLFTLIFIGYFKVGFPITIFAVVLSTLYVYLHYLTVALRRVHRKKGKAAASMAGSPALVADGIVHLAHAEELHVAELDDVYCLFLI